MLYTLQVSKLLELIDAEIASLQRARALIAAAAPIPSEKKAGRPAKAVATPVAKPKKHKLSPEGRARLVAAVKARWAKQRKAAK